MPAIVDITVENDGDFYYNFAWQDPSGNPIDLTGMVEMVMKLRRQAEDAIAVLELSTDAQDIKIYDPVNGLFSITVLQSTLVVMELGTYDQSLVATYLHGVKVPIWSGSFTINAGASR
jgi:hypothetical protein